ncbi:Deoxyribonuclease tatD [Paramicrosporidium saccamoebae]|uniref:Deoxyribonuclease tatD n=1 Tax=Paramicrosporidium saccamoebae TaxID=1246581 RepID=A0A2H9TK32_9FUNG|nr:Deoxyribonuclease tatD [Paramicrosporidium saccamoebae]
MDGTTIQVTIFPSSLKTAENLAVVKSIPLDRVMVESDAPWCEIRPSHAGFSHIQTKFKALNKEKHDPEMPVKSRNEPFAARQVLEVLSSLHQQPLESIAELIHTNSTRVFGS